MNSNDVDEKTEVNEKITLQYKQFVFDLKADKHSPILKYYNSLPQAYDAIKHYMLGHEFLHRQGSSYLSKKPMSKKDVSDFVMGLCETLPWLSECSKKFDVADAVFEQHDMLPEIDEACEIFNDKKDEWLERRNKKQSVSLKNDQSDISSNVPLKPAPVDRGSKAELLLNIDDGGAEEVDFNFQRPIDISRDSVDDSFGYGALSESVLGLEGDNIGGDDFSL